MKKVLVADNLELLETKLYNYKNNEKKFIVYSTKGKAKLTRHLWSCTNCNSKGSLLILICNSADTDCSRGFEIGHNLTYVMNFT